MGGGGGPITRAVAVYDYEATRGDELSFTEGDVILVVTKNADGYARSTQHAAMLARTQAMKIEA